MGGDRVAAVAAAATWRCVVGEDARVGSLIGALGVANTVSTDEDLRSPQHLIYVAKKRQK
ncbi:hypothetical protein E2C01_089491 [Portunus trituberculatus]|uniref:Uncharacterized protein n=1 Tax=Portunus trituberculatus TaxID=210409 RepID=A0A5B7JMK0_PORTR|nr:hypothetical protein [Portunus trituberculatus]